jgi:AcrR family transcriptional regulator
MAAIAEAAGVSIETLYLSVGPKAAMVRQLVEVALSGTEDPVPGPQRAWVRDFVAEPDCRLKMRLHAAPAIRRLHERLAPIWSVVMEAAPGDADLRALVDELEQRRLDDMRLMAQHLADSGALRKDLSVEMAADILWVTNATEFHRLLKRRGWEPDVVERWLADAWIRLLL